MARIRTIKPSAFTSESLANCSIAANWTFAGIWTYVDDEGRGRADARLLKGALYPLRDEVGPIQISEYLAELEDEGCICRYSAGGRDFMHVVNWDHQSISKPTASKLPRCPKSHSDPDPEPDSPGTLPLVFGSGESREDSGESPGSPGVSSGEVGIDGPQGEERAGQHGESQSSGESQGNPGSPGDSHAGTGNREQGSGTGNREQGARGARDSPETGRWVAGLIDAWTKTRKRNGHTPSKKQLGELSTHILDALEDHPRELVERAVKSMANKGGWTRVDNAIGDLTAARLQPDRPARRQATSERAHADLEAMKDPPSEQPELPAVPGGF